MHSIINLHDGFGRHILTIINSTGGYYSTANSTAGYFGGWSIMPRNLLSQKQIESIERYKDILKLCEAKYNRKINVRTNTSKEEIEKGPYVEWNTGEVDSHKNVKFSISLNIIPDIYDNLKNTSAALYVKNKLIEMGIEEPSVNDIEMASLLHEVGHYITVSGTMDRGQCDVLEYEADFEYQRKKLMIKILRAQNAGTPYTENEKYEMYASEITTEKQANDFMIEHFMEIRELFKQAYGEVA